MDPRTKFRGEVELRYNTAASGLLLPDVTSANIAFLEGTGNDGTAVVGDPFRPFYTAQAAITALIAFTEGGACTISAGIGSFGDMDITGAASLTLIGVGAGRTYFGAITSSTLCNISGNGAMNVTVGEIVFQAPNGADGSPVGTGENGHDGATGESLTGGFTNLYVSGLHGSGDCVVLSGNGGKGSNGGDSGGVGSPGGNGGNGGNGTPLVCTDCIFDGYAVTYAGNGSDAGNGGDGGDTGNGGNGGNTGNGGSPATVTLIRTQVRGVNAQAATAGVNPGLGGTGVVAGSDGSVGTDSSPGGIYAQLSQITDAPTQGEGTYYQVSIQQGIGILN